MNEHSSRSHSVFRVKIEGVNETNGERCVGVAEPGRLGG